MSRAPAPELVIETRRTSASSSAGNQHVQRRRQRAVAARHFDAILVEGQRIGVGFDAARLEARRPRHAAADVLAGRDRSRNRRRWRLRASASRPGRPSGCIPSQPTSASWRSDRWKADAWPASPDGPRANRRPPEGSTSRALAADFTSAAQGRVAATSRGMRSCSNSSLAWTIGSAWKRRRITPSSRASAMATIVMP